MDDSQSSDFLANSADYSCNTPENLHQVNAVPYDTLILRTKNSISETLHCGTTKFSLSQFTSLLADCSSCILQSLDLIIGLLVDTDVHYKTLTEYMEHAGSLLQLLTNYINTAVESVSMSCCNMKMFPATTGNIVLAVFTHCKDSETLYGSHLKHVQRQLKDLFRTCHELQLTYLMVLEKHFIFDVSEKEEQDTLIEALDINLAIGEIVQTLDVKTMAEQWKAYTMICEKHASFLSNKEVYQDCSKILCNMTTNNITTALEADQEDKIVLRSLKVASFAIKILLKLYKIFESASEKNYTYILELLVFINKCNPAYLELELGKANNFIKQMTVIVFATLDLLLAELVSDEAFLQCCLLYSTETPRKKDEILGFIVLIASVIDKILNKNDHAECKHKIIKCIFNILPKCHIWFSYGLKFTLNSPYHKSCGLYEHILIRSIALASTLSSEEYSSLEQDLFQALLGTDFWSALFASDLWVALSRNNRQLHIEQFVFLCKTYQKLENKQLFCNSPQQVYLSYTIARLFEAMNTEDKIRLYSRILALWSPLQIKNIPPGVQEKAVKDTSDSLLVKFDKLLSSGIESEEEIRQMSKLMKAAATCSLVDIDEIENCVTKVWIKSCPKNRIILSLGEMDKGSLWYLEYIEALVALTKSVKRLLNDNGAAKILHVMENIAQLGNTELNIVLLDLLCQLSLQILNENMNQLESLITQTYKTILQKNDSVINSTLCKAMLNYSNDKNFEYVLSIIFSLDNSLQDIYSSFIQDVGHADMKRWKDHLISDHVYAHKCVENAPVIESSSSGSSRELKENSNNFDFADIDSLFEGESDSEPASKKAKFTNIGRNEEIISRLEKDSLLLCSEKENFFCNDEITRIRAVCERLKNIID